MYIILCSNRDTERVQFHQMAPVEAQTASEGEMKLHEQLQEVTSMEELLLCVRDVSPDWSTIRDELVALKKIELAEEVYKRYILPKLRKLDICTLVIIL